MGRAAIGHLRKLPSKRWQARFTYPDGVRRSKTFETKSRADAWLSGQRTDVERGVWKPQDFEGSESVSFEAFTERWLKNRKVKGRALKPRTLAGYRDLLTRFIYPDFANKALHTIERDDVERWYDRTAVDTPTYRAKAYSLLRTILHNAVEDGHLALNPARIRGAGQTERLHIVRPATGEELDKLTASMPPRYRLLIQLAAWCALRYGELTELRRNDIDTVEGVIRVRRAVSLVNGEFIVDTPKSAAGVRNVAIPPHLLPLVREHLLAHTAPGEDGLLFPSRNDPKEHLRQSSLTRVYYPAREKAARPDLRFHDLRHTGAVYAAQAGATPAELMGRLGHSTVGAAMRYQHAAQGRDAVIAARLSDRYEAEHPKPEKGSSSA